MSIACFSFLGVPQYECDLCGKFWIRFNFVLAQDKVINFHFKLQAESIILKGAFILTREITWE